MDEQFRQWLIAHGEDPSGAEDYLSHPLKTQYETEQQLETVWDYFDRTEVAPAEFEALCDFAQFMLGFDRKQFDCDCLIAKQATPEIYHRTWAVFHLREQWLNEVADNHNS